MAGILTGMLRLLSGEIGQKATLYSHMLVGSAGNLGLSNGEIRQRTGFSPWEYWNEIILSIGDRVRATFVERLAICSLKVAIQSNYILHPKRTSPCRNRVLLPKLCHVAFQHANQTASAWVHAEVRHYSVPNTLISHFRKFSIQSTCRLHAFISMIELRTKALVNNGERLEHNQWHYQLPYCEGASIAIVASTLHTDNARLSVKAGAQLRRAVCARGVL